MNATISECGKYRYTLSRCLRGIFEDHDGMVAYFGVNPSTADHTKDDPTTLKWKHFTLQNNFGSYVAVNAFAFRSPDVKTLASQDDPIGPLNDRYIDEAIECANVLIPCWGSSLKLPKSLRPRLWRLTQKILASGKPVYTFGLTKTGDPRHPLFLPHDTVLRRLNT